MDKTTQITDFTIDQRILKPKPDWQIDRSLLSRTSDFNMVGKALLLTTPQLWRYEVLQKLGTKSRHDSDPHHHQSPMESFTTTPQHHNKERSPVQPSISLLVYIYHKLLPLEILSYAKYLFMYQFLNKIPQTFNMRNDNLSIWWIYLDLFW